MPERQAGNRKYRVLIVEDQQEYGVLYRKNLQRWGYEAEWTPDLESVEELIHSWKPDVLLLDNEFPGDVNGGLHLLQDLRQNRHAIPVIVITMSGNTSLVHRFANLGMVQYVVKESAAADLRPALKEAESLCAWRREEEPAEDPLLGQSQVMQELRARIRTYASEEDLSILVEGETGTGKELVAEAIHRQSPRAHKELTVLDCTNIQVSLAETKLFGHVDGAYTGAGKARPGAFENANNGVLFVDEISELPLEVQGKFLRVLETGTFSRLGEGKIRRTDVQLVAASNRNLLQQVRMGAFRDDLLHRLSGLRIRIPPLQERLEDIPLLVGHVLEARNRARHTQPVMIQPDALEALARIDWEGNVRQLMQFVQALCVHAEQSQIQSWLVERERVHWDLRLLGQETDIADESGFALDKTWKEVKAEIELRYFRAKLEEANGIIATAAELAGVHRKKFYDVLPELRNRRQSSPHS